jgi:hypothetical protein
VTVLPCRRDQVCGREREAATIICMLHAIRRNKLILRHFFHVKLPAARIFAPAGEGLGGQRPSAAITFPIAPRRHAKSEV